MQITLFKTSTLGTSWHLLYLQGEKGVVGDDGLMGDQGEKGLIGLKV